MVSDIHRDISRYSRMWHLFTYNNIKITECFILYLCVWMTGTHSHQGLCEKSDLIKSVMKHNAAYKIMNCKDAIKEINN